jgi:hypothetical protein
MFTHHTTATTTEQDEKRKKNCEEEGKIFISNNPEKNTQKNSQAEPQPEQEFFSPSTTSRDSFEHHLGDGRDSPPPRPPPSSHHDSRNAFFLLPFRVFASFPIVSCHASSFTSSRHLNSIFRLRIGSALALSDHQTLVLLQLEVSRVKLAEIACCSVERLLNTDWGLRQSGGET